MARSHLTLAALATAAVPGLDVTSARSYGHSGGEYDSAILWTREERKLFVRVPNSQAAETEQSADALALRALTTGVRGRLSFDVPEYLGQAPIDDTRGVVYDFLEGAPVDADSVQGTGDLAPSIGGAIAAVHSLPSGFVAEAGLPVLSASECHASTAELIETAAESGRVPAALRERWRDAVRDTTLWQFQPTVINGALTADSLLISNSLVSGVLGWSALRVGDPARDLHWLLGMNNDAVELALAAYGAARRVTTDHQFTRRALLYAELEIVRWLLHGLQMHDDEIVDDAVGMLDALVERVHTNSATRLSHETGPIMAVSDVEAMLDETPLHRGDSYSPGLEPVEDKRDTGVISDFRDDD